MNTDKTRDELFSEYFEDREGSAQVAEHAYRQGWKDRATYTAVSLTTPSPISDQAAGEQRVAFLEAELASATRMFHDACHDLGLINEALGLDPDDGGAEPILDAIAELKSTNSTAPTTGSAPESEGYAFKCDGKLWVVTDPDVAMTWVVTDPDVAMTWQSQGFIVTPVSASPAASVLSALQIEKLAHDVEKECLAGTGVNFYMVAEMAIEQTLELIATNAGAASDALSSGERELFEATVEQFADCNETDTDDAVLMDWARRGFLECTHFEVTKKGIALLAASMGGEKS